MNKLTISLLLLLSAHSGTHLHAMRNNATDVRISITDDQPNMVSTPKKASVGDVENQGSAAEQKLTPPRVATADATACAAKQGSPSTQPGRKKLSKIKAFKKALKERLMSLSPLKREAIALALMLSAGTAIDVVHYFSEGFTFDAFWLSALVGISEGVLATIITSRHN